MPPASLMARMAATTVVCTGPAAIFPRGVLVALMLPNLIRLSVTPRSVAVNGPPGVAAAPPWLPPGVAGGGAAPPPRGGWAPGGGARAPPWRLVSNRCIKDPSSVCCVFAGPVFARGCLLESKGHCRSELILVRVESPELSEFVTRPGRREPDEEAGHGARGECRGPR